MEGVPVVRGGCPEEVVKHGVVYDFTAVWDEFPFANCVGHERDVVDWSTLWVWEVAVAV
jgi:hypothetical protein